MLSRIDISSLIFDNKFMFEFRKHIPVVGVAAFFTFLLGILMYGPIKRGEFSQVDRTSAACDTSFFTTTMQKSCLVAGQQMYSDDSRFTFFNPASTYINLPYVQLGNASVKDLTTFDWGLTLQKAATVYIFTRHIPGIGVPNWISQNYTRGTTDDLSNINQYLLRKNEQGLIGLYDIWSKNYASGTNVQFHAASDAQNPAYSMYLVALKASSGGVVSVPTPVVTPTPTPNRTATPVPTLFTLPPVTGGGNCSGSSVSPGQSLASAISSLGSGQTLCVHGGTYGKLTVTIPSGATVKAYPGEKVWVEGISSVTGSSGSVIDGINFRWGSDSYGPHMVSLKGNGWTYINGEVGPSHGYANVLISGGASNWRIANCYMHDNTDGGHTDVQDHLIYASETSNGIIERCIFANSPRGRGVKMGPPSGSGGPRNITVRYNTFYNNLGPSNMQVSGDTSGVKMYRNLLAKSGDSYNISDRTNGGTSNSAYENAGDGSSGVAPSSLSNGGGANVRLDPQLGSDFRPRNPAAQAYGRYAP